MNLPQLPWDGGCRCGKVRFRITKLPLLTMACHCTGCQKMSASAFSMSMAIPLDGMSVTAGKTVPGGLHAKGQDHRHCAWCNSWLFTRLDPAMGFTNVRPSMLDDTQWFAPFVEVFTCEGLPWAKTGARHSYKTAPAFSAYEALTTEFAAHAFSR